MTLYQLINPPSGVSRNARMGLRPTLSQESTGPDAQRRQTLCRHPRDRPDQS